MSVQCVLRVFKWVKSQLWFPDGGRFDPDHSDRPGLWCAAAYYWHYRETGIFLPNHFQLLHTSTKYALYQLATPELQRETVCMFKCQWLSLAVDVCFWESVYLLCYMKNLHGSNLFYVWVCADIPVSCKMSCKISSINVHIHTRACGNPACLR